jgi:hypothetical protein
MKANFLRLNKVVLTGSNGDTTIIPYQVRHAYSFINHFLYRARYLVFGTLLARVMIM